MNEFDEVYKKLNTEQKRAVDNIDGPMLVIAGPGTGKTQLLSARVANILKKTDTLPQNILCLTFTENGATNMRERLSSFIGQSAYDVAISTYHAFGEDLIRRYGQYFEEDLREPADNLTKHQIVSEIVDNLSYRDPLKQTRHHIKDLIATLSEIKRGLLSADELRAIAGENEAFMVSANTQLADIFAGFERMPRKYDVARDYFNATFEAFKSLEPAKPVSEAYGSLANVARLSLELALIDADAADSTKPLTAWKNAWLAKSSDNTFIINAELENRRLNSLAKVLEQYEAGLRERGLYDFDDMILKAITALKQNDDLRLTLQEQYQYILLDEYQDTNRSQAELVYLLTDNPVHEGKANVMAVGDDDQAIYAFQGAQYSNMLDFFKAYRETKLVSLKENYRSGPEILELGTNLASQINERLLHELPGSTKELVAANKKLTAAHIERRDFASPLAEYDWTARQIDQLVKQGTAPSEIAVLTPRHKSLEALVPYLKYRNLPIRYEKRENILETPLIRQLLAMCRLSIALSESDEALADSLWPAVLSSEWYRLPVSSIWQLSWMVSDNRYSSEVGTSWTREMFASSNAEIKQIAHFFAGVAQKVSVEPCEYILDLLVGETALETNEAEGIITSPLKQYFVSSSPAALVEAVSHLAVLRSSLRDRQKSSDQLIYLRDLIELADAYAAADEPMLNTSPYAEAASSVQLMTVYKAKGLEFSHVFLLGCNDEQWGMSGRDNSNKLTLPHNLAPTRHSGTTEDERLRLMFVAATRAKRGLYLTNHTSSYSGKRTTRLKFLDEREDDEQIIAHMLPAKFGLVASDDHSAPELTTLQLDWSSLHTRNIDADMKDLLKPQLDKYQLSPTHLNSFCDLVYGGPEAFFLKTILRFPSAPTSDSQYGNAVHETLEWLQHRLTRDSVLPDKTAVLHQFEIELRRKKIPEAQGELLIERGKAAMSDYLDARTGMFNPSDRAETSFKNEGVFVGKAHLSGKIDRLEINEKSRLITVVDYKTGRPHTRWSTADATLHKYRQQLICYKLLVEGSHSFKGYSVSAGRLEFVEPDEHGQLHQLKLTFNDAEVERTRQLLEAVWNRIQELDFPDISEFSPDAKGIRAFEDFLLH